MDGTAPPTRADRISDALLVLVSSKSVNTSSDYLNPALLPLCGSPILVHLIRLLARSGVARCVIVVRENDDELKSVIQDAQRSINPMASTMNLSTSVGIVGANLRQYQNSMRIEIVEAEKELQQMSNSKSESDSSSKQLSSTSISFAVGLYSAKNQLVQYIEQKPFLLVSAAHMFSPSIMERALCSFGNLNNQQTNLNSAITILAESRLFSKQLAQKVPTKARLLFDTTSSASTSTTSNSYTLKKVSRGLKNFNAVDAGLFVITDAKRFFECTEEVLFSTSTQKTNKTFTDVLQSLADQERVQVVLTEGRPWYCVEQCGLAAKLLQLVEASGQEVSTDSYSNDAISNADFSNTILEGPITTPFSNNNSKLSNSPSSNSVQNYNGTATSNNTPNGGNNTIKHSSAQMQNFDTDPVLNFLQRMSYLAEFERSLPGLSLRGSLLYVADVRSLLWKHALHFGKQVQEGIEVQNAQQGNNMQVSENEQDPLFNLDSLNKSQNQHNDQQQQQITPLHSLTSILRVLRAVQLYFAFPSQDVLNHIDSLLQRGFQGVKQLVLILTMIQDQINRMEPGPELSDILRQVEEIVQQSKNHQNQIQMNQIQQQQGNKFLDNINLGCPGPDNMSVVPSPQLPQLQQPSYFQAFSPSKLQQFSRQSPLIQSWANVSYGEFWKSNLESQREYNSSGPGHNGITNKFNNQNMKKYFELLVVGRMSNDSEQRVKKTFTQAQQQNSGFLGTYQGSSTMSDISNYVYSVVIVPSFEDAIACTLFNHSIQAILLMQDFDFHSTNELKEIQSWLGVKEIRKLKNEIRSLNGNNLNSGSSSGNGILNGSIASGSNINNSMVGVLAKKLRELFPSFDLFHLADSCYISELGNSFSPGIIGASNSYQNLFKRIFHNLQADAVELNLSILQSVSDRAQTPFFDALTRYAAKPTGVFHALPLSRGNSILDQSSFQGQQQSGQNKNQWISDFGSFYGQNVFLAETSSTIGGLDSLLDPSGPIKKAQILAAKTFGSQHTFFGTNGTSTSNKIVLQALIQPNDVILIDRNCHKSHHYGAVLQGGQVVYLDAYPLHQYAMYGLVSLDHILTVLNEFVQNGTIDRVKVLLLTNSTFDGLVYNVEEVMSRCLAIKPDLIFLWDEAWWSFAYFSPTYRRRTGMEAARVLRNRFKSQEYRREWIKEQEILKRRKSMMMPSEEQNLESQQQNSEGADNRDIHVTNSPKSSKSGDRESNDNHSLDSPNLVPSSIDDHIPPVNKKDSSSSESNNNLNTKQQFKPLDLLPRLPNPDLVRVRVYSTQSTHKTLSAFRQGSMIHISDDDYSRLVDHSFHESFMTHTSTSPNYQILASLDIARRQMALEGYALVQKSVERAMLLRQSVQQDMLLSKYFYFLDVCDLVPSHLNLRSIGSEFSYSPEAGFCGLDRI